MNVGSRRRGHISMRLRDLIVGAIALAAVAISDSSRAADFARDVQPIFAANCYECHGAKKQMADLRLDERAAALDAEVIVPGDADNSELYRRITLPKNHD